MTRVHMVVSVGGDLVAGEEYDLPFDRADELIVKGYAEGRLSRDYDEWEVVSLRSTNQVVNLG